MRLWKRLYRMMLTEAYTDLETRIERIEYRLQLIHRTFEVDENPTLVRAVEADLARSVRIRLELEAELWRDDGCELGQLASGATRGRDDDTCH